MPSLIGRIKQNRIGAVVVSVFDWYRESPLPPEKDAANPFSLSLSHRGEKAITKARSRYPCIRVLEL